MTKEKRKKILVVTHIRQLWSPNQSGSTYAINSLIDALSEEYQVDIYCTKYVRYKPGSMLKVHCGQSVISYLFEVSRRILIRKLFKKKYLRNVLLNSADTIAVKEKSALNCFLKHKNYDLVIVEYLHNHHLLSTLRKFNVPVALDAHDVMHLRSLTFKGMDLAQKCEMTEALELDCLSRYDTVFVIQEVENKYLRRLGMGNTVVVKRPAAQGKRKIVEGRMPGYKVKALFIGSSSAHNIDALRWFVVNVWNTDLATKMELYVVGSVCNQIDFPLPAQVYAIGPLANLDEIYLKTDVALNPIRVGSGLKIKNVEALGYGLPVVTSPLGADGMSDCVGSSVIVCDVAQDYVEVLSLLCDDKAMLKEASQAALRDSEKYFSKNACFDDLKKSVLDLIK